MQSNTTSAFIARSMVSVTAVPPAAPTSQTRAGDPGRIGQRLGLACAAFFLVAPPLGAEAGTAEFGYYSFPAAQAAVSGSYLQPRGDGYYDLISEEDIAYDLNLMTTLCGSNHVRSANLSFANIGFARAQAGKDYAHFASAGTDDGGIASAAAGVWVAINDPQNRETVKLNLTIQGFASASDPLNSTDPLGSTAADYALYVGRALDHTPHAFLDGCTVTSAESVATVPATPLIFAMTGYDEKLVDLEGNLHLKNGISIYRSGVKEGESAQSYGPMSATFEVEPNRSIVIVVTASSAHGGLAVIDPIITAHPDNPDVQIEISSVPDEDTGQHPLDGVTKDDLDALGIDPQPFISLGFLNASSPPPSPPPPSGDTTPPTTLASATPGANASGWNNAPVTVTLAATDNAGGSGVREVHYSLAGAPTGSQIVPGAASSVTVSAEGTTTVSYFAVDNAGNQEAAKSLAVRIDQTAPSFAGLPATGCTLWPPDRRLVQVASVTAVDDGSGVAGFTVDVTSSEPETGASHRGGHTGAGDEGPDIIVNGGVVQLRAERAGDGTDRVYTITANAIDLAGNVATETRTCVVPHDRSGH